MKSNGKLKTKVLCKETNNGIYLHWRSFAPILWKKGILKTLIRRAYTICFNDNLLEEKLHYIETHFTEIHGYPKWLLKQTVVSFKTSHKKPYQQY